MLPLVESFLTIQGEGKYSGYPSLFVRFGGCNLSCVGFEREFTHENSKLMGCDSAYAVFEKHFGSEWKYFDDSYKLFESATKLANGLSYLPHVVITGGEPLIHYKNRVFYGFLKLLIEKNFQIFVETNATINLDFEKFPLYKNVNFAMGVKLSNSMEKKEKRINKEAIKSIIRHAKTAFFKFVLDDEIIKNGKAKEEIQDIVSGVNAEIFCMPLGKNNAQIQENAAEVVNFCIKNGYNYTDRTHIRIWNEKRGV